MIDPAELEERRLTAALNRKRAERRRELYQTDPLWRLSKLKQNREDRLRTRRASVAQGEEGKAEQRYG